VAILLATGSTIFPGRGGTFGVGPSMNIDQGTCSLLQATHRSSACERDEVGEVYTIPKEAKGVASLYFISNPSRVAMIICSKLVVPLRIKVRVNGSVRKVTVKTYFLDKYTWFAKVFRAATPKNASGIAYRLEFTTRVSLIAGIWSTEWVGSIYSVDIRA
jgi:hypothetical protein